MTTFRPGVMIGLVTDSTPDFLEYGSYRGYVAIDPVTGEWVQDVTDVEREAIATELAPPHISDEYEDLRTYIGGIDPVGAVEIAERLGVDGATVEKWRQRGIFPKPLQAVDGQPEWHWPTIEAWAQKTDRL